jgi:hypothetical protein
VHDIRPVAFRSRSSPERLETLDLPPGRSTPWWPLVFCSVPDQAAALVTGALSAGGQLVF